MNKFRTTITIVSLLLISLAGCQQKTQNSSQKSVKQALDIEIDTTSRMIKFENALFSIPSPHQLSILIKDIGANFNSDLLNQSNNYTQYTSIFKQTINLGIYGADLAYLNMYEQFPLAINYFSVIKIMSQQLDLTAAFSPEIFKRIENNIDQQDSLLYIISNLYTDVDLYLKESQRQKEGALILVGGWIEASYFLVEIAKENNNPKLIERIGENKQSLDNLIKLLTPYYEENEEIAKLTDDLIDVFYEYESVEMDYKYAEPTTYPDKKLTQIHSESKVVIPSEVFENIRNKITNIRKSLIQ